MKATRNLTMLVGACVLGLASTLTMAGAASAEQSPAAAVQTFKNQATRQCLDDSGKGLRTIGCNGKITQKWRVQPRGKTRQLTSVGTGECLDDSKKGLRTFRCLPGSSKFVKHQRWLVKRFGDGTIRFQNQATKLCVDDSSKGLRHFKCNTLKFQSWF